jgi:hypothetical protein
MDVGEVLASSHDRSGHSQRRLRGTSTRRQHKDLNIVLVASQVDL